MSEEQEKQATDTSSTAQVVYILYLVGLVFGVTGIVGVVMAYLSKDEAEEWLQEHYRFQIRTFWIGALYIFIGALTFVAIIGYFIMIFWMVWLIIRCIKGLQALEKKQPPADPTTWLFG